MMKNNLTYLLIACTLIFSCSIPSKKIGSGKEAETLLELSKNLVSPPNSSRPGAFWCWLNGDVTKESITNDLEEMKDKGMARAEIWDVGEYTYEGETASIPVGPRFLGEKSL